ncbi:MAG TPA: DUF3626 domain-containing protein [Microscillaceae bacterium]|nr:DUF3626 domain-containing protein [Microscillaceae bacterium]
MHMSERDHNRSAIEFIEAYARQKSAQAHKSLAHVCEMSNISQEQLVFFIAQIQAQANIVVHFHPYRLNEKGKSVLELLIESKRYKSQFETNLSNGALDPKVGGKRDQWENLLFGNTYDSSINVTNRPKYGALDLFRFSDGPAPRFGSCFLVLKPQLTQYATFTYLDSHLNPEAKGTIRSFESILANLLLEAFERDFAIGYHNIRPHQLLDQVTKRLHTSYDQVCFEPSSRNLNHYIEAQIHTDIQLDKDVDCLVADYAYQHTEYEKDLALLCEKCEIKLIWNKGLQLAIAEVPNHFRGKEMPLLAQQVAIDQYIHAYALAKAEQSYLQATTDPSLLAHQLQQLKYLWHILVKYGQPIYKSSTNL